MKKSSKKKFADFKSVEVKKSMQKKLKGGEGDSIIVEEVISN